MSASKRLVTAFAIALTWPALGTTASPLAIPLQIRDGRPIVGGVYVNGRGPYRFLIDTGATLNHLDPRIARDLDLKPSFDTMLRSATGSIAASAVEDVQITVGPAQLDGQIVLLAGVDAVNQFAPGIDGVLGEAFLSRFDYLLDVRKRRLVFGGPDAVIDGTRTPFSVADGRPVVVTNIGPLVLDSGAGLVVRFGVDALFESHQMFTVAGSVNVGTVWTTLSIDGRRIWNGEAAALPHPMEEGPAGLLPTSVFNRIFVCNSERYVILD